MVTCFRMSLVFALIAIIIPFIYKYKDQREYNYRTTAEEAIGNVKLNGKTIIVTGSNTGIGKQTVKVFLSRGAQVIMACRDTTKAVLARRAIIRTLLSSKDCDNNTFCDSHKLEYKVDVMQLDLASLASIDSFVKHFEAKYKKLNYLILNAGTVGSWNKWSSTKDGIEMVFGVNHIGHYHLTMELTALLTKTAASTQQISRVISVSSAAHKYFSPTNITQWLINDNKVQDPKEYGYVNYGFSKACNVLFAKDYNDRYAPQNVFAVSVHPGVIATELSRNRPLMVRSLQYILSKIGLLKTWSQGAATTIRTIALNDEEFIRFGGSYFVDCNVANDQLLTDLFPDGHDPQSKPQFLLWNLTNSIIESKIKALAQSVESNN